MPGTPLGSQSRLIIEESSGFMRMIWNYGIDGVESATSYSTEKEATAAAIELAERLAFTI